MNSREPIANRVFIKVEQVDIEEKSIGGIILSTTNAKKRQCAMSTGIVVALGPKAYLKYDEGHVEVGDYVHFQEYGGRMVWDYKDNPEKQEPSLRVINDEDTYLVVKKSQFSTLPESVQKIIEKIESSIS